MNCSKFKLKKICTVYQVIDSYHFNDKHSFDSYLKTIVQILTRYDLTTGVELKCYKLYDAHFDATFERFNCLGVDIECTINFLKTTLTITVKE